MEAFLCLTHIFQMGWWKTTNLLPPWTSSPGAEPRAKGQGTPGTPKPWGQGDSDDETKTPPRCDPGWWQLKHVLFKPYLGKWSNLTFAYFFKWVGEKHTNQDLCLGSLRDSKNVHTYVKRQACSPMWFLLEMWRHLLGHVRSKEPLNAVRQLMNSSINSIIHRFISDDVHMFNHGFHHIAP